MKRIVAWGAAFLLSATAVFAAGPSGDVPERNGDYPDPVHPGVRVRVFVHEPGRPQTVETAPVCTDDPSAAVVSPAGWHLPANWTYSLNPSSVPASVGSGNLGTMAGAGFTAWSNAVTNKVSFNRGSDTGVARSAYDGLNVIAWGRTQGSALGVTYIRYYVSNGLVVDVDTIMNKKFAWGVNACGQNVYDAANVLVHEQGHWLGLDDEYTGEYLENTMYGYASRGETKKTTLTQGDKVGAQAIY